MSNNRFTDDDLEHMMLLEKGVRGGRPVTGSLDQQYQFQGMDISVENSKGTIREDKKHDPPRWRVKMLCDYGYIRGSEGSDGDHVDCYVGGDEDAGEAYVVDQNNPETGEHDEQKAMLGFRSLADAKRTYMAHFDDRDYADKIFAGIQAFPVDEFREKVLATREKRDKMIKVEDLTNDTTRDAWLAELLSTSGERL